MMTNIPDAAFDEETSTLLDDLTYDVEEFVGNFFESRDQESEAYCETSQNLSVRVYDDLFIFVTEDGTYGSMKGVQIVPGSTPLPLEDSDKVAVSLERLSQITDAGLTLEVVTAYGGLFDYEQADVNLNDVRGSFVGDFDSWEDAAHAHLDGCLYPVGNLYFIEG